MCDRMMDLMGEKEFSEITLSCSVLFISLGDQVYSYLVKKLLF